jgi:hypothetical protein
MESEVESQVSAVGGQIKETVGKADFRKLLALIVILGGGAYLWRKAESAQVIAYVFGIMSTAIGYFFNTTQSSQDKTKQIQDLTKKEVA